MDIVYWEVLNIWSKDFREDQGIPEKIKEPKQQEEKRFIEENPAIGQRDEGVQKYTEIGRKQWKRGCMQIWGEMYANMECKCMEKGIEVAGRGRGRWNLLRLVEGSGGTPAHNFRNFFQISLFPKIFSGNFLPPSPLYTIYTPYMYGHLELKVRGKYAKKYTKKHYKI